MALPIEDYALIGDTETAALVGKDGSVDWLCLPRFDSPACFAALLGTPEHGRWLIGPVGEAEVSRRYVEDSFVLETTYSTPTGTLQVIDAMPVRDDRADLVRRVECVEGTVQVRHEWVVRFAYGKVRPWVSRHENAGEEVITAVAGPDRLVLRGPRLPKAVNGHHVDEFEVHAGEVLRYSLTWRPSHLGMPKPLDVDSRIETTLHWSDAWADRNGYQGPFRDAVTRSLLTLRLLTHSATGGIVAAPTTSLPENPGGGRNWDYRYCWLRDASMTVEALLRCGYRHEVQLWRQWLLRAVAGDPEDLQIMYAVDGSRQLPERTLDHLPGYAGSRPVRVGNEAVEQRQSDVLGEVMAALHLARTMGIRDDEDSWAMQCSLVEGLERGWNQPDNGIWEIRGPQRHFTHSRVLVWTAFDRAVRAVEEHGYPGPVDRWRTLRDTVHAEILDRGVDHDRGTFVQHYDSREVDAALLVLPTLGFIAGDDPLMLGTVAAVEEDLVIDGLVHRYRPETGVDGLSEQESPFLACSFWLASAYAAAGRVADAESLLGRLVGLANDLGLLAEEYDPAAGTHRGNFPQALSHLALVNAALDLEEARSASMAPGRATRPS